VSQETTNRSFDDLARALAEGSISRRRALKLFAGTALAALIPSTRAMAAITCPPGTVKICHVPQRADGTCRRGEAETRCLTPEAAARHAGHPCDCCGGCGGTDNCLEPKPQTCFSTSTTSTSTSTTSTTTLCIPNGETCSTGGTPCCSGNCSNGFCCESGRVGLSNGTCALPCTSNAECSGCGSTPFCGGHFFGPGVCTDVTVFGQACSSDIGCPAGQYCNTGGNCAGVC
jgi:hypothetical protein